MKQSELLEARDTHCSDKCCGSDVKAQDCKCPPTCKHCNCNAKNKMDEGLAELAGAAERDHEVQMARAELYKIAKYAIKLHEILKGVSEAEGIEGWMQSKITKSADYMSSVYHSMDYENKFSGDPEQDLKASYEDLEEKETKEGKSPHAKGTKKYKKHMAAMHAEGTYKNHLQAKLDEASACADDCDCDDCNCCSECGNPSWKNVSEDKKKGSHGKVCWKGYRRGEGNSCHRVKGDG